MFIEETKEEMDQLLSLSKDEDRKIAFLARYIRKLVFAHDDEDMHQQEQRERHQEGE
jgi:hypothetical protein